MKAWTIAAVLLGLGGVAGWLVLTDNRPSSPLSPPLSADRMPPARPLAEAVAGDHEPHAHEALVPAFVSLGLPPAPIAALDPMQIPAEPVFASFADWIRRYRAAPTASKKGNLENEGMELARQRLAALAELIQTNPARALELQLPEAARHELPGSLQAWLEETVNTRGDYEVVCRLDRPGQPPEMLRAADIRGQRHQVFTYGAALDYVSRTNAPLNGVAVPASAAAKPATRGIGPAPEKLLALHPNPARLIETARQQEMMTAGAWPRVCAQCAQGLPEAVGAVALEYGGEPAVFCLPEHGQAWLNRAVAAEQLNSAAPPAAAADLPTAESSYTEGTKRLLFMRVGFPDYTNTISSNTAVTLIGTLSNYFATMSNGKFKVASVGSGGSAVTPVMRMPNDSSYYDDAGLSRLYPAAKTEAGKVGYNTGSYQFIVVFTTGSKPSYGYAGLGYVGGVGVHIANGYWQNHTVSHELGHNLGLWHAKRHNTSNQSIIGAGETVEYGNYYDQMGAFGNDRQHYGASYKNFIDWVPDSSVKTAPTGTTTYRLYAHDRINSSGVRGIKVSRSSSQDYWAEFRQLWSDKDMRNGLLLLWSEKDGNPATMLDAMPGMDGDGLAIGRTFSDTSAGVHITPIGRGNTDPDWMDVVVTSGNVSSNKAPKVIVSASRTSASTGQSITFTADATDPNGDALAYYWEYGDGAYSTDNEPEDSHSFSSTGEYYVQCTVTDMKGGVGRDTVLVRVGSPSTYRISGRVLDSGSKPVAGIKVFVDDSKYAYTDSDGTYSITRLAAGDYTVKAREYVKDTTVFTRAFFSNPVHVGPTYTNANFITSTNPGLKLVFIHSPADDAVITDPPNITVGATAQGQTNTVTRVEFYANNLKFGEDTNTPYSATWTNFTAGTHLLKAKATFDNGSSSTSGEVSLTVNLTDLPPTITAITNRAINEDSSTGPIAFTVGDTLTPASNLVVTAYSANTNLVPAAGLRLSGTGASRTLTVNPATNLSGSAVITLVVNDGKFTNSASFTLTVNPVNDPPWVIPPPPATIGKNLATLPLAITVGDLESAAGSLTVAALSGNPALVSAAGLALGGSGNNRTLTVTPQAGQTGAVVITLWVSDGVGSNAANFTLTVNITNFPPTLAGLANRTVLEDTPLAVPFTVGDLETPLANLVISVLSSNAALVSATNLDLSGAGAVRTLGIAPATNAWGTTLISVSVSDGQLTVTSNFLLTVTAVAEPPAPFSITSPASNGAAASPVRFTTDASDPDDNIFYVNFVVDGATVGTAFAPPWSFSWSNAPIGQHRAQALAVDSTSMVRWSAEVGFSVIIPPIPLISTGAVWSILATGQAPPAGWEQVGFNASAWPAGPAELGYGDGDEETTIPFGGVTTNKWITTYLRHPFVVNDPAGVTNLVLNFKRDDGVVLYLNGRELLREGMDTGAVTHLTFATNTVDSADESDWLTFSLDPDVLGWLRPGTNLLAAEVHQASVRSSDISFDLSLIAHVATNRSRGLWLNAPASVPWLGVLPVTAEVVAGGSLGVSRIGFFTNGMPAVLDTDYPWSMAISNLPAGPLTISALAADSAGGVITGATLIVQVTPPPAATALINFMDSWKYLDTGEDPGVTWVAATFPDASWSSGAGRFGYGGDGETTRVSYGPSSSAKYRTTWFRKKFFASGVADFSALRLRAIRDDGVVLYLNGTEIFRDNLPPGAITLTNFALAAVGGTSETEPVEVEIANLLVEGENVLAAEVHQATATSSDLGFDLELLGLVATNLAQGVYLSCPAAGQQFLADVPLAAFAQAASAVARVDYYAGDDLVAASSVPPYAAVWTNAPGGRHSLTARARLANGEWLTSPPVAITVIPGPQTMLLVEPGAGWRYLDNGTDPGTNWFNDVLDDTEWPAGPAKLGFGDTNNATTLAAGSVAYYFRQSFFIPINYTATNLALRLLRDDGAVVYLNGQEVHRDNMPEGDITPATLAVTAVSGASETAWQTVALDPGALQPGLNLIAVEVHQVTNTSSDLAFDLALTAIGQMSTNIPPPDPPLVVVEPSLNGRLHFSFPQLDGQVFVIEASSDLKSWVPVATNIVANGQFNFYADPTFGPREQFYRVRWER